MVHNQVRRELAGFLGLYYVSTLDIVHKGKNGGKVRCLILCDERPLLVSEVSICVHSKISIVSGDKKWHTCCKFCTDPVF